MYVNALYVRHISNTWTGEKALNTKPGTDSCAIIISTHLGVSKGKQKFVLFKNASGAHWFSYHRLLDIKYWGIFL